MNWDDPAQRAALIEQVGVTEYNARHAAHMVSSTVSTVDGYDIRPVQSRFGRLFQVSGTGQAFRTLAEAEDCARKRFHESH